MGHGKIKVRCADGNIRMTRIPGKMKKRMKVFKEIIENNKDKVVVIRNQKELDKFIEKECKIKGEAQ